LTKFHKKFQPYLGLGAAVRQHDKFDSANLVARISEVNGMQAVGRGRGSLYESESVAVGVDLRGDLKYSGTT
jgi:hypothetical protein